MLAGSAKSDLYGGARSRLIRRRNLLYFRTSLVLATVAEAISLADNAFVQRPALMPLRIGLAVYLLSRCNEVFYAFYRDAVEKLIPRHGPRSGLSMARRLRLSLNSYVELVIDFALFYFLLPADSFKSQAESFADHLFYSASTITTSGGGGIVPIGIAARLLTDYEVFCGLILIVVCFAVYVGQALAEKERRAHVKAVASQAAASVPGATTLTMDRTSSEHDHER